MEEESKIIPNQFEEDDEEYVNDGRGYYQPKNKLKCDQSLVGIGQGQIDGKNTFYRHSETKKSEQILQREPKFEDIVVRLPNLDDIMGRMGNFTSSLSNNGTVSVS
jgi:hypothetical protein